MAIAVTDYAPDRDLVRRLLAGDERSFEEFFDGYFPKLYRFALARLRNHDDAEEVVQATLSRAVRKLATYRGEASLLAWLIAFCRHEIGALFARKGRDNAARVFEDTEEVRAALDSLATSLPSPEESVHRGEVAHLVQAALDSLPGRYGDALEWKYALGLSIREIAHRLEVSEKAAESLLTRARDAFRDAFTALSAGVPETSHD